MDAFNTIILISILSSLVYVLYNMLNVLDNECERQKLRIIELSSILKGMELRTGKPYYTSTRANAVSCEYPMKL